MTADKGAARRRAREAKARADAERIEREKKVDEAAEAYFDDDEQVQALKKKLEAAEAKRDRHLLTMLDLGCTSDYVAARTELTTREVKRVRRASKADEATDASSPAAPTPEGQPARRHEDVA